MTTELDPRIKVECACCGTYIEYSERRYRFIGNYCSTCNSRSGKIVDYRTKVGFAVSKMGRIYSDILKLQTEVDTDKTLSVSDKDDKLTMIEELHEQLEALEAEKDLNERHLNQLIASCPQYTYIFFGKGTGLEIDLDNFDEGTLIESANDLDEVALEESKGDNFVEEPKGPADH